MELKPGYKQTEVGVIPEDWDVKPLSKLPCEAIDCHHSTPIWKESGEIVIRNQNIRDGRLNLTVASYTDEQAYQERIRRAVPSHPDLVITREAPMGEVCMIPAGLKCCLGQRMVLLRIQSDNVDASYVLHALQAQSSRRFIGAVGGTGSTVGNIRIPILKSLPVAVPAQSEQRKISAALGDINELIIHLERLIIKKHNIKQAAMQELLTGKRRLPGFEGEWGVKTIEASADCFDSVRVPLNETQRGQMSGDYPYCGANGVLDFVSDFVIDDDIILMAEDGGYFDEYKTRPIAYRMKGRCWVNNHAHILKAKPGVDQGFLFYSLVHKNILPFLASGTRAKLNKSEMNKIAVRLPCDEVEQVAIAAALSEMDSELASLEARKDKTEQLKQGMMQQLLTGKIRLI
jgi:type I restriction enzyme S subunit